MGNRSLVRNNTTFFGLSACFLSEIPLHISDMKTKPTRPKDAILDRILKKHVNALTLKRLKKKAGVTMITRLLSIDQVKDLSWDARKRHREVKTNAPTHR